MTYERKKANFFLLFFILFFICNISSICGGELAGCLESSDKTLLGACRLLAWDRRKAWNNAPTFTSPIKYKKWLDRKIYWRSQAFQFQIFVFACINWHTVCARLWYRFHVWKSVIYTSTCDIFLTYTQGKMLKVLKYKHLGLIMLNKNLIFLTGK